ncbi:unnamed protein product, partial [Brassica oleracea var. botrytis]
RGLTCHYLNGSHLCLSLSFSSGFFAEIDFLSSSINRLCLSILSRFCLDLRRQSNRDHSFVGVVGGALGCCLTPCTDLQLTESFFLQYPISIRITEDTWQTVSSRPLRIVFGERGKV